MGQAFASEADIRLNTPMRGQSNRTALLMLSVLYFMLGFITCLNDTLVPFFKRNFDLSYAQSSLVQFYFFLTYGVFSIPIGKVVERTGYRKGMIFGFLTSAAGAMLFWPAAHFHVYYLFLTALFVIAVGIVFMQVAANPYIIALGSPDTAAGRLNLVQSVGSVGTIAAPVFGATFILPDLNHSFSSDAVIYPYAGIAILLVLLSILIAALRLPDIHYESDPKQTAARVQTRRDSAWRYRNLVLGAIGIFSFVGIEVAIGSFLTNYITDAIGVSEEHANRYVAYYWGGMLFGRLAGVLLLKKVKPRVMLVTNCMGSIALILISINTTGNLSVWSLIAVGITNSVMFAIIFSLAVKGLGRHTTQASGILSTAISGGAFVVLIQGYLIDSFSWSAAFLVPVACYLYIIFYGISGHRPGSNLSTKHG